MSKHLNEQQLEQLGRKIIEFLDLRPIRHGDQKGRYDTAWGTKTELGLGACVARLVLESDAIVQAAMALNSHDVPSAPEQVETSEEEAPDVYYRIWGGEQTNIDFYQAVKVSDKTVTFRQVKAKKTYNEDATSGGTCVPEFDNFDGAHQFRVRFDAFEKVMQDGVEKLASFYYLNNSYRLWEGEPLDFTSYG